MLIFLTILNKASGPYWNTLRKSLAQQGIAPLTITHAPNLVGHPIGILILIALGMFVLPSDPLFFLLWFGMIAIAAVVSILTILGFLETKFFTTQIIGSLGFVSSSVFAMLFLGERLNGIETVSLFLGTLGVIFFCWPKTSGKFLGADRGTIFTILAVILGGVSSVLYKLATFHVSGYQELFTGRFVGDLIGWTIIWLLGMWILNKSPKKDLVRMVHKPHGQLFIAGLIVSTFLDSWLIYKLPVSTIAIVGIIAFPVSYFISHFKYRERITPLMWFGTACIVISVVVFLLSRYGLVFIA